ncbi:tetratricopeptide repeat protein [Prescottella equi]|uniref:tetratricopeptide repeat protein n=1 Tax=Rhodococcus hoagii TaxID=43767 RepID=UPI001EEC75E4|nr:NB-ARC domain-containing protein [Prescottella equi]
MHFVPLTRMKERADLAREDSDTSYFFDLLYMGEFVLKFMVIELVAGLEKTTERHRYQAEYELVRADSIGKWISVIDDVLRGPASQSFCPESRESVIAWTSKGGPGSTNWQRRSVELMIEASNLLDVPHQLDPGQRCSLEDWANLFVAMRNRTRGHGAPRSTKLGDACLVLGESIQSVVDNMPVFDRSWAYLKRGLSGKYRVSPFGGDRNDYSYLTRQAEHTLEDGVYVFLGKPIRTNLVTTDVDLTDFYLANGNYRKKRMEFISYVSDLRCEVYDEVFNLPVEARRRSETSALSELEIVGESFSNLPSPQDGYIRRTNLENSVADVLVDSRNPVVTLKGRGGVGKTSLALHVLHNSQIDAEFFAIVWFSARDIDLLPTGPKVVRPDVLSLDDIALEFAGLVRPDVKANGSTARKLLAECLSGEAEVGPFLFVLDNFETLREQGEVYDFFNTSVRLPNKVLITTRSADFKSDYPIEVGGLNRDEYASLVRDQAQKLRIQNLLSSAYEDELYEESSGHPYITKVLLGEVAASGRKATLRRVIASQESLLNALFERSYANLSAAGQRVFLILCSWRSVVPGLGLEAVILRPANEKIDVRRAVDELEIASLVDIVSSDGGKYFLSVPQSASVFGRKKLATSSLRLAVEADLEFLRAFGAAGSSDLDAGLVTRIRRFASFVAQATAGSERFDQGIAVLEYIANDYSPAWLVLGELFEEVGKLDDSTRCLKRYVQENVDDHAGWRRLERLHRKCGNAVEEVSAAIALAEVSRSMGDLSDAMNRFNRLIANREVEVDADERSLMARRLRAMGERRVDEADAGDLSRLAWLCLSDKDPAAAKRYTALGLARDPSNPHCLSLHARLRDAAGS